ncbi:hypothetical protein P2J44_14170 [Mannheimia haemolytica]|nr:hypothetical protein [Mannheimia haemolytica]
MSYDANDALNEIEEALSELERVAEDAAMVHAFGAWIETDSEDTSRRVHNALVTAATGTEESVKVAKE